MEKILLSKVIPDENQPRKYFQIEKMSSLKDSIKKHGIVNPLIVEKHGDKYLIIDGERRFRAATELGLKEVPIAIIESKDPVARKIEQFHIQEQHEGWQPVEKAQVLIELCEVTNKPLTEVCEMLAIPKRTAQIYFSFSKIQDKDRFTKYQVNIANAEKINAIKTLSKKLSEERLEVPFGVSQEKKMERALLERIKDGEIVTLGDFSKIKDSFTMNPKNIEKFMETDVSISEMFVRSKARSAYALRNMINNSHYLLTHASNFLEHPDVAMSADQKALIKSTITTLNKILQLAG